MTGGSEMRTNVRLRVWGDFACFTRPEMKVERYSYDVMTPSAARGILEAIHWKPAISWIIDEIHVLKPIRFKSIRRNEVKNGIPPDKARAAMKRGDVADLYLAASEDRTQRASIVLADVEYVICAHFVMTEKAGEDDSPPKHFDMFTRRARNGQCFQHPCFGTREFVAHFELLEPDDPLPARQMTGAQAAQLGFGAPRDLGFVVWDRDYTSLDRTPMVFRAQLYNGVLRVPQPGSQEIRR